MHSIDLRTSKEVELVNDNIIDVVARSNPFSFEKTHFQFSEGLTIYEILKNISPVLLTSINIHVFLDGRIVEKKNWKSIIPKEKSLLNIHTVPATSGGGSKSIFKIVLLVAVVAALYFIPGGPALLTVGGKVLLTAGGLAKAAIGIGASLAIKALSPPAKPKLNTFGGSTTSRALSLNGSRNQTNPYGVIPKIFGRHRMTPYLIAQPVTTIVGDDQYLSMLFGWGLGPLNITDIKIGETSIDDFNDVQIETVKGTSSDAPITLYDRVVFENPQSIILKFADGFTTITTEENIDTIIVDYTLFTGLVQIDAGDGTYKERALQVDIEVSVSGADDWKTFPGSPFIHKAKQTKVLRYGQLAAVKDIDAAFVRGQYDVRIKRGNQEGPETTPDGHDQILDEVTFTSLKSIRNEDPETFTDASLGRYIAKTAIRIKATDQLNGVIDNLNGIVEAEISNWNGVDWDTVEYTSNPASCFREALKGVGNIKPVTDSRIDLTSLQDWHDLNESENREFNAIYDFETDLQEVLNDIAASGRASLIRPSGKIGVVIDKPQTVPVQHFTPFNSFDFSSSKVFKNYPHGLKVPFVNRELDWELDERIVHDDNYTESNATEFEDLELFGITDKDQIYKDARYHIAVNRLRKEIFSFKTDVEGLICTKGDLILLSHDVPLVGVGHGRVKSIFTSDGNTNSVSLDNSITMQTGKLYRCRFRLSNGDTLLRDINLNVGTQTIIEFSSPIVTSSGPQVGDLFMFGEVGTETLKLLVKSVEVFSDLSVRVVCLEYAEGVYTADSGAIPPYNPGITLPIGSEVPIILSVRSDTSVLKRELDRSLSTRILVTFAFPLNRQLFKIKNIQGQIREDAENSNWENLPKLDATAKDVFINNVDDKNTYQIRFRYEFYPNKFDRLPIATSRFGSWSDVITHTVIGKSEPPQDVKNFTAEVLASGIILKWDENTDIDLDRYEIRKGSTWETGEFIERVRGRTSIQDVLVAGNHTYMIKAIDTSGNYSTNANTITAVIDEPALPIVSSSFSGENLLLTITGQKRVFQILEHEIRKGGTSWGTSTLVSKISGGNFLYKVDWEGSQNWWVASIDIAGNYSDETNIIVDVVKTTIDKVETKVLDSAITFKWGITQGSLPVTEYEFRKGDTFSTAEVLGKIKSTFNIVQENISGSYKYWIVSIDSSGNYGIEKDIEVSVNSPLDFNLQDQFDTDFFCNRTNVLRSVDDSTGILFDGIDDEVTITRNTTLDLGTTDFTIEFILRLDSGALSSDRYVFSKVQSASVNFGCIIDTTGYLQFFVDNASSMTIQTGAGVITEDTRHHVAIVIDRDSAANSEIYIDGTLQTSGTPTVTVSDVSNTADWKLGFLDISGGLNYLPGKLEEFRIWDDVRSSTEINDNKDIELEGDETNLIGYWRFNEGADSTAKDLTANEYDATLNGPTWDIVEGVELLVPSDITETWDSRFTSNSWGSINAKISAGYPYFNQDVPTTAEFIQVYDAGAVLSFTTIKVNLTYEEIVSGGTITTTIYTRQDQTDSWTTHSNGVEVTASDVRYIKVKQAFTSNDKQFWKITKQTLTLSTRLKTFEGVATINANPTTVTIPSSISFAEIKALPVNHIGSNSYYATSDNWKAVANPTTFKINLFDQSGSAATGDVSYIIRGI